MIHLLTRLFPLWAILLSTTALIFPSLFAGLRPAIIPLLSVVMFCMGMTLKWSDFKEAVKSPKIILIGVLLQYFVMPLSAFLISRSFGLSPEFIAGMVLVGSSAGGTASNVICYLAKGNVALSITLTMASTLIAVFAMPALSLLYLHQIVHVPFLKMLFSILQMVLIPVLAGTTLNTFLGVRIKKIGPVFPFVSTIAIVVIIAIIIGLNQTKLREVGFIIVCAVMLHNLCGLLIGFWLPKSLGYDDRTCRTLSIEVGMQNSGLSVALAIKHFS
ncbi:MAG: bile acid:sodium symporter family protein, partial [Candidatus Scalindua sp.]|nr:bile acid:sodium symporter family protein [Candidatus Scalindua sp.]